MVRILALPAVILLAPLETAAIVSQLDGVADGYNRVVVLTAMDIGLLALAIAMVANPRSLARPTTIAGLLLPAMAGFAAFAWLFHPSLRGASVIVRLAVASLVVMEIRSLDRLELRNRVVLPLVAASALQTVIVLLQAVEQGPIGLAALGERSVFHQFGSSIGAQGTLIHPYPLAGFAMITIVATITYLADRPGDAPRWTYLSAIAVAAVPLGLTYSRMSVIGLAAIAAFALWGASRNRTLYLPILTAVALGALLPALIWNGGWIERASDSVGSDIDAITSNRLLLTRQAIDIAADNPWVGVGPGLYTNHLEQVAPDLDHYDAVHTVPLVVAAENGMVAGVVVLAMLVVIGLRTLRIGPAAAIAFGAFLPFVVFDKFPYIHPNGIVMLAIWLAILDRAETPAYLSASAFDGDHAKMTA